MEHGDADRKNQRICHEQPCERRSRCSDGYPAPRAVDEDDAQDGEHGHRDQEAHTGRGLLAEVLGREGGMDSGADRTGRDEHLVLDGCSGHRTFTSNVGVLPARSLTSAAAIRQSGRCARTNASIATASPCSSGTDRSTASAR